MSRAQNQRRQKNLRDDSKNQLHRPQIKKTIRNAATIAATPTPPAAPSSYFVGLHDSPTPDHPLLDPSSVMNEDAWKHGRLLRIGEADYMTGLMI